MITLLKITLPKEDVFDWAKSRSYNFCESLNLTWLHAGYPIHRVVILLIIL
ncbi:MAG: hypothetical protein KAH20_16635 [Methylococcales bacterium]|nr:hypothetical protein [Methylococcales bacterium]